MAARWAKAVVTARLVQWLVARWARSVCRGVVVISSSRAVRSECRKEGVRRFCGEFVRIDEGRRHSLGMASRIAWCFFKARSRQFVVGEVLETIVHARFEVALYVMIIEIW